MTIRTLAGTSALVLLMSSTALLADVTPEQVWQGWQDAVTGMGNKVTVESATRDGNALVVTNITLGDPATSTVSLETISFEDNGDGTVGVVLPDAFPIKIHNAAAAGDATGKPTDIEFTVTAAGTTITASGTPEAISYKTDAPSVAVNLNTIDGASAEEKSAQFELVAQGVASTYGVTTGDLISLTEDLAAKSIALTVKGKNDTDGSSGDVKASLADLTSKWDIKAPKDMGKGQLTDALAAGFSVAGSFGFGTTSFDLNSVDTAGKSTQVTGGLASASLGLTMNASTFDYATDSKGAAFKVVSPDVPIPDASFSYGQAGLHLVMPVAKSDTPADFSFVVNLIDLAPSEAIWSMADPANALKHDPATLIIDTKGKATMTRDIFADAAALEGGSTAAPGLLNALDLTNINLKALGAEIISSGAFTFDNSDMTTFSGVPAPTGKLDIKATGVNAVIDTLVKMGLVPQDQAMQYRMMLSMFANTSTTADEMTSTLEFKDKHFFANGQQLQ
jgi:hypothetical protein